jgi:CheY-like chemotaxis protein
MTHRDQTGPSHDVDSTAALLEPRVRALVAQIAALREAQGDPEQRRRAIARLERLGAELLGLVSQAGVAFPPLGKRGAAAPAAPQEHDVIPPPAASSRVAARRSAMARPLAGVRVLVVDDENDARDLAAMVLAQAGAEVTEASSAAEALRALQRQRPHVVVSDIGMPGQDGHTLIRAIRDLPSPLGAVRAMAVTAFARSEDRHRSLDAGFDLHVVKPVDPANLVGSVARLMGRDPTVAA